MHVGLTDEQELLRQTARALAAKIGPHGPAALRPRSPDVAEWRLLADAGLLALRVPEAAGGMGASGVEVAIVAEALGGGSATVPFLGSAVMATELVVAAGGAPAEVIDAMAAGDTRASVALDANLSGLGRHIAFDAAGATTVVLVDGDDVLLAPRDPWRRIDASDLTRELVRVDGVDAVRIGSLDTGARQRWEALALTALSADMVGVMGAALDAAVAYVKDRVQFGVAVGSFQAVQHLLADQLVTVEGARSALAYAAWAVDELEPAAALLAARTAKAYASEGARDVCEAAIQAHGGIGMTWECMAHVHLRRVLLDRQVLGDEHAQLAAIAASRFGWRR